MCRIYARSYHRDANFYPGSGACYQGSYFVDQSRLLRESGNIRHPHHCRGTRHLRATMKITQIRILLGAHAVATAILESERQRRRLSLTPSIRVESVAPRIEARDNPRSSLAKGTDK